MFNYDFKRTFTLHNKNFIKCPLCNNKTQFAYVGERIDFGIFSMRIACAKNECNWASEELLEDSGYFPKMGESDIQNAILTLRDYQKEIEND